MDRWKRVAFVLGAVLALLLSACGGTSDAKRTAESEGTAGSERPPESEAPTIVVTTNILGEVVANLVGDSIEVVTIMPVGADPHDFQASAKQVAQMSEAEVLIVNGAGFEEGLLDVIESVEGDGVAVFDAISAISSIGFGAGGRDHEATADRAMAKDHRDEHAPDDDHDEHAPDDEDDHDEHADHDHGAGDADPHFFTDPARMAMAAEAIGDFLIAHVADVDAAAIEAGVSAYVGELQDLDAQVAAQLAEIPEADRVLITNHEVFGYFAERYDFEVIATVIPSGSTLAGTSAQSLADLAETVREEGVRAIFAETSASTELAETLATEARRDIKVVELFSESLGPPDSEGATYLDMVRTNANRIVQALAG